MQYTAKGRIVHEGGEGGETFTFYGHNPHNGEPWRPITFTLAPGSPDLERILALSRSGEDTDFSIPIPLYEALLERVTTEQKP